MLDFIISASKSRHRVLKGTTSIETLSGKMQIKLMVLASLRYDVLLNLHRYRNFTDTISYRFQSLSLLHVPEHSHQIYEVII